jgi:hypothetical protein
MKRFFVNQLVIAALIASAAFLSSCDKDPGDENNGNYLIAGKFASQTGVGDAVFYAEYASGTKSSVKSGTDTETELVGKIEHGDIIFTLRGVYSTESKQFFLSAGSSILIFQIVGTLTDDAITNTQATVKVKQGDDWITHTVPVTSVNPDDVSIDGAASNTQTDGLPTAWYGDWAINFDGILHYTLTSWQFLVHHMPDYPAGFLDIVSLGNNRFEMIWEMWSVSTQSIYDEDTGTLTDDIIVTATKEFCKIWLEPQGQGLLLTAYWDSLSDTVAGAKAYNIANANAENTLKLNLYRP